MMIMLNRLLLVALALCVMHTAKADVTDEATPGPAGLTLSGVSTSQATLSWNFDPAFNKILLRFQIERQRDGEAGWTVIGSSQTPTYQDAGLEAGTVYNYQVCAITQKGRTTYCDGTTRTLPGPPKVPTRLSQAQAVQVAQAFCQTIGYPVTASGTAEFAVPEWHQKLHWQPRWRVVFPRQADVEIVDATGVVSDYDNRALSSRADYQSKQPAGDAIPEADAIQKATVVMQATGLVGELASPQVRLQQGDDPPLASTHTYFVIWPRVFEGAPYREQQLTVNLNAETGEIMGLGMTFPSMPPSHAATQITQEAAEQTAQAITANAGLSGNLVLVQKEVIQPNRFWEPGGKAYEKLPGPAHVAWVCQFDLGQRGYEVWVDAVTGDVIGGTAIGSFGGKPKPKVQPQPSPKSPAPKAGK